MENHFTKLNKSTFPNTLKRKASSHTSAGRLPSRSCGRQIPPRHGTWPALTACPYLKTDCGYFVEVEVTVEGVRLVQIHPVLDAQEQTDRAAKCIRHQHLDTKVPSQGDRVTRTRVCISMPARICPRVLRTNRSLSSLQQSLSTPSRSHASIHCWLKPARLCSVCFPSCMSMLLSRSLLRSFRGLSNC